MTRFFPEPVGLSVGDIAALVDAEQVAVQDTGRMISDVRDLASATQASLAPLSGREYADQAAQTQAGVILTKKAFLKYCPEKTDILVVADPSAAVAQIMRRLFPTAVKPLPFFSQSDVAVHPKAEIHPDAQLEDGVVVEPLAVIGADVAIGRGTRVCAGSVIGDGVQIGRDCSIGPNVAIQHALIGDGVILHPGVRIGQDGFGYTSSAAGHEKIPQVGRVVIQNHVEIGANSCVDRGSLRDTVVGEGTRIDNFVQVAHNAVIGRHCMLVGGISIAGSATLGDFVVIGGHTVVNNHKSVGTGARVAAVAVINDDVPPGETWSGVPAIPAQQHFREHFAMRRLAQREIASKKKGGEHG